jgi:hypothetical protein
MTNERLNEDLHPHIALLLRQYSRDLGEIVPSRELDARIDQWVAAQPKSVAMKPRRAPMARLWPFAAAAGFAAVAIGVGVLIGMKLEHSRKMSAARQASARDALWPPANLTMWPTDSVSFKIPAEYSAQGNLVAVDPESEHGSARYWIDVVVSNDGTFRIERIVPAEPAPRRNGDDGLTQSP